MQDAVVTRANERSGTTDAALVGEALSGSQSAFHELVTRYSTPAVNLIARLVQQRALAEDLAQEAFIRAFQRLASFDPDRKFSSWFFQIAHNVAIDHLRRRQPENVSLDTLMSAGHAGAIDASAASSPAAQAERAELGAALDRALSEIRPEYRSAIVLHYQEDLGHADISSVLGVPVGTVKTYLHRGRKELAARMAAAGWAPVETLEPKDP